MIDDFDIFSLDFDENINYEELHDLIGEPSGESMFEEPNVDDNDDIFNDMLNELRQDKQCIYFHL